MNRLRESHILKKHTIIVVEKLSRRLSYAEAPKVDKSLSTWVVVMHSIKC